MALNFLRMLGQRGGGREGAGAQNASAPFVDDEDAPFDNDVPSDAAMAMALTSFQDTSRRLSEREAEAAWETHTGEVDILQKREAREADTLWRLVAATERGALPTTLLHAMAQRLASHAKLLPRLLSSTSTLTPSELERSGGVPLLRAIAHSLATSASNRARCRTARALVHALVDYCKTCEAPLRRGVESGSLPSSAQECLFLLASALGAVAVWLQSERGSEATTPSESLAVVLAVECNGLALLSRLLSALHVTRSLQVATDGVRSAAAAVALSALRCLEAVLDEPRAHALPLYRDALRATQIKQRLLDAIGYPPCPSLAESLSRDAPQPEALLAAAASSVEVQASSLRCVSVWYTRHEQVCTGRSRRRQRPSPCTRRGDTVAMGRRTCGKVARRRGAHRGARRCPPICMACKLRLSGYWREWIRGFA